MPLQSSGAISLADMHNFFGLGYSFASYRGRGAAPGSGPMSFSQLYGATKTVREPSSGEYNDANYRIYIFGSKNNASPFLTWVWAGTVLGNYSFGTASITIGAYTYFKGSGGQTAHSHNSNGDDYYSYNYGIYRTGPG